MASADELDRGGDRTGDPFMCSFCFRSRQETGLLVGAPTSAICRDCAAGSLALLESAGPTAVASVHDTPWDPLTNQDLLNRLPQIAKARDQVEEHLKTWVAVARSRNISWASIGASLEMTRQSAWERFR